MRAALDNNALENMGIQTAMFSTFTGIRMAVLSSARLAMPQTGIDVLSKDNLIDIAHFSGKQPG